MEETKDKITLKDLRNVFKEIAHSGGSVGLIVTGNELVYSYIQQETGLSRKKAMLLWKFVKDNHTIFDKFDFLDKQIALYNNIKK